MIDQALAGDAAEKLEAMLRGRRWSFGKKARQRRLKETTTAVLELIHAVRDEERLNYEQIASKRTREWEAKIRSTRLQTLDRVCSTLRRDANLLVKKLNKRGAGATNRQKLTVKIMRAIADRLEQPVEKPTPVEDDD